MRLLALLVSVILICGCVSPLSKENETAPQITPTQTVVEGKFKELNEVILKGLKEVFGNITVVDVVEGDNFIHVTNKIPKSATDEDFERFVGSLGFKVAFMSANLNGKVYEVHVVFGGNYVNAELKPIR